MADMQHLAIKYDLERKKVDRLVEVLRSGNVPPLVASLLADMLEADKGLRLAVVGVQGGARDQADLPRWVEIGRHWQNLVDNGASTTDAVMDVAIHFNIEETAINRHLTTWRASKKAPQ